jgi:hypothetical protein
MKLNSWKVRVILEAWWEVGHVVVGFNRTEAMRVRVFLGQEAFNLRVRILAQNNRLLVYVLFGLVPSTPGYPSCILLSLTIGISITLALLPYMPFNGLSIVFRTRVGHGIE